MVFISTPLAKCYSWLPKGNADQASWVDEDNLVSADNDELRAEIYFASGILGGCGQDNGIKSTPNSPAKCYKILSKSLQIMHKYAWWHGGSGHEYSAVFTLNFAQENLRKVF